MSVRIDRMKLKIELVKREIGRKKFAEKAGLGLPTVTAVTSGKSCSLATAQKIADALQMPLEKLLERCDY